jgi:hypothetical protein
VSKASKVPQDLLVLLVPPVLLVLLVLKGLLVPMAWLQKWAT